MRRYLKKNKIHHKKRAQVVVWLLSKRETPKFTPVPPKKKKPRKKKIKDTVECNWGLKYILMPGHCGSTPVVPVTLEVDIGRIVVHGQCS
jgi:hypothetical protein